MKQKASVLIRGLLLLIFLLLIRGMPTWGRGFPDYFIFLNKLVLSDSALKFGEMRSIDLDSAGRIFGIDSRTDELKIFSAYGLAEKTVLPPGKNKGGQSHYDVACWRTGFVWVAGEEILLYDAAGRMLKSFKQYNEADMKTSNQLEDLWGANITRLDVDKTGMIVGAGVGFPTPYYLHTFDKNGKLVKEFYLLDPKYDHPDVFRNPSVDVDSLGDIWCTFPPLNRVSHYGMNGTFKNDVVIKSPLYKSPESARGPRAAKEWLKWLATWTPVVQCAATQSGYVITALLAGDRGKPLMPPNNLGGTWYKGGFFVDIYDRQGNLIAGGLHTPHRFLTVDNKDYMWFDLCNGTPENPSKTGPIVLGKFRLNLKPVTVKTVVSGQER